MHYDQKETALRKKAAQMFLDSMKAKGYKALVSEHVEEAVPSKNVPLHSIYIELNVMAYSEAQLAEQAAEAHEVLWVAYPVNGKIHISFE